jgi:hypothetical protein
MSTDERKIRKCPFCSGPTEISTPTLHDGTKLPKDERCSNWNCNEGKSYRGDPDRQLSASQVMQAQIDFVQKLQKDYAFRAGLAKAKPEAGAPTDFEKKFLTSNEEG